MSTSQTAYSTCFAHAECRVDRIDEDEVINICKIWKERKINMASQEYIDELLKTEYSLDDYDYLDLETNPKTKTCPLCNKLFYGEGRNSTRQRYCKRTHVVPCVICGKPVPQKELSEKYSGIKWTCSRECNIQFRKEQTLEGVQRKYGVANVSQLPAVKKKMSIGIKAKSAQITEHRMKTMDEVYGGSGTASPIIRAKIEGTMMKLYGVINPDFSPKLRQKMSEIAKSEEVQAKYAQTAMMNWGVDRPSKLPEIINKMKQTNLEKYGHTCTLQTDESKEKLKQVSMEKYGVENPLLSDYAKEKARQGFIEHMHDHNTKISQVNQQVANTLKETYGINVEYEFMIGRKSYDLLIVDSNILIEIDPTYTHASYPNHWNTQGLDSNYHLEKSNIAKEAGYRCIHLFDWDDPDKIYLLLENKKTLYARKCKLEPINHMTAKQFLDNYHIQGSSKGDKYRYGLYYKGELVQVMTFGTPRYNKHYQWELLRLCTAPGKSIIGGASRLFKHFIKDINPTSILSYCDRSKFTGDVYTKIGMTLHHISPPAKIWSKDNKRITDNWLRARGYDQLFNTNYGKGTSNEALMLENGWRPIFDCGQMVFEYRRE